MMRTVNEASVLKAICTMMDAGVPSDEAIEQLALRLKDKKMAERLSIMVELCRREGMQFSQAMEQVGLCANYASAIKIGDQTGRLLHTLRQVGEILEEFARIRRKIKNSMIYPGIVIVVSVAIWFFLTDMMRSIMSALSFPGTAKLFAYKLGWFIVKHKAVIIGGYIFMVALVVFLLAKNAARVPVIRGVYNKVFAGQGFKLLAMAINSGMTIEASFAFAAQATKGLWRAIFEDIAAPGASDRSMEEIVEQMEGALAMEDYVILMAQVRAGESAAGFDMIGKSLMQAAFQRLEALTPLVNTFAILFIAFQIVMMLTPIYMTIFGFMDVVNAGKGGI